MRREQYLATLYKVWGVDDTPKAKLEFWEELQGLSGGTDVSYLSEEEQLIIEECFQVGCPEDDHSLYPNERHIRVEKWCFERGVSSSPSGQLRYFEYHFAHDFYFYEDGVKKPKPLEYFQKKYMHI